MDDVPVERMTFAEMFILNQSAPIGHPFFKAGTDESDAFTVRFQSLATIVTPDDLRALADKMEAEGG